MSRPTTRAVLAGVLAAAALAVAPPASADRAHLYASAATESGPSVEVATIDTSYAGGLELSVSGTGFTAVTNPGDAGVYVGLAPSGGLPETDDQEDMDKFAAAAWVMPHQMADGTFTVDLVAPTDKLVRGTDYSVYTWQAHSHSNTTQDTETPVSIDWDALRAPTTVKGSVAEKPTSSTSGRLRVTVAGAQGSGTPRGTIEVDLVRNGMVKDSLSKRLKGGRATLALPKLAKGEWRIKVRYLGSGRHLPDATTVRIKVTR